MTGGTSLHPHPVSLRHANPWLIERLVTSYKLTNTSGLECLQRNVHIQVSKYFCSEPSRERIRDGLGLQEKCSKIWTRNTSMKNTRPSSLLLPAWRHRLAAPFTQGVGGPGRLSSLRAALSPHVVTLPVPRPLPSPPLTIPPTQGAQEPRWFSPTTPSAEPGPPCSARQRLLADVDTPRRNARFKSSDALPLSVWEQVGGARGSGRWPLPPIPALRLRWW